MDSDPKNNKENIDKDALKVNFLRIFQFFYEKY